MLHITHIFVLKHIQLLLTKLSTLGYEAYQSLSHYKFKSCTPNWELIRRGHNRQSFWNFTEKNWHTFFSIDFVGFLEILLIAASCVIFGQSEIPVGLNRG